MTARSIRIAAVATILAGIGAPLAASSNAGAVAVKSSGKGTNIDLSWIEYDPADLLGLPGNTHVGYLYAQSGQWGTWIGGSVSDFDCDEGEFPWGGHHVTEAVVDQAQETADAAVEDALDGIVDSGGSVIDAGVVAAEVQTQLADDIPDEVQDEFEEFPICDFVGERFLDGTDTATVKVDLRTQTARVTGKLIVHGGHGDHGEPGTVLGRPSIDLTIVGGEWSDWTSSYSYKGRDYRYSMSEKGRSYYGGAVSGRIGAMGFADDADDESHAGFGGSTYKSSERVR